MSTDAAINTAKKTGSKTGGTSHSRTLNLGESDMPTACWFRRERNALSHR
jgi:hypothetical protein